MPDGAFRTVVFPLHSNRLPKLVDLLASLNKDSEIAAIVNINVFLTEARIDYVVEQCPDIPDVPEALARHSRNAVGLPCNG